ncbi:hypothetical protein ES707_21513 [subsurface metagenome]
MAGYAVCPAVYLIVNPPQYGCQMTTDDRLSPITPRIQGIHEQYYRARRFLQLAHRCKKARSRFTNLIAAVYFARAIVELMLEAAEKQELRPFRNADAKESREQFKEKLAPTLPHYYLVEKIRIHDFHRFGCIPPSPKHREAFWGGPIRLIAKGGAAALRITPKGPEILLTGNSRAKEQRPLYMDDGRFFEEESKKLLSLEEVLRDFLGAIPSAIAEFEHFSTATIKESPRGAKPLL